MQAASSPPIAAIDAAQVGHYTHAAVAADRELASLAALQVLQRKGSDNWGTSSQRCSVELAEALLRTGDVEGALAQLQAPAP